MNWEKKVEEEENNELLENQNLDWTKEKTYSVLCYPAGCSIDFRKFNVS